MLGRAFGYAFTVMEGDRIGRTIGFPTMNQHFPAGFAVPKSGVYVSQSFVENQWRDSITNIGRRPTLNGATLRSETHILGFDGDLYGQDIPVRLLAYLPPETKFAGLTALQAQIQTDLAQMTKESQKALS